VSPPSSSSAEVVFSAVWLEMDPGRFKGAGMLQVVQSLLCRGSQVLADEVLHGGAGYLFCSEAPQRHQGTACFPAHVCQILGPFAPCEIRARAKAVKTLACVQPENEAGAIYRSGSFSGMAFPSVTSVRGSRCCCRTAMADGKEKKVVETCNV
jgi:hypothetical protein